jgi:hypothetical protein
MPRHIDANNAEANGDRMMRYVANATAVPLQGRLRLARRRENPYRGRAAIDQDAPSADAQHQGADLRTLHRELSPVCSDRRRERRRGGKRVTAYGGVGPFETGRGEQRNGESSLPLGLRGETSRLIDPPRRGGQRAAACRGVTGATERAGTVAKSGPSPSAMVGCVRTASRTRV